MGKFFFITGSTFSFSSNLTFILLHRLTQPKNTFNNLIFNSLFKFSVSLLKPLISGQNELIGLFHNLTSCPLQKIRGCPRGVMVKAMGSGIVVSEFVLQSRYYVLFRANTLGKGKNPLILQAMG